MTKKEKLEQFDGLKREHELYVLAMSDYLNGDVQWSGWVKESGGGSYRVGWIGSGRANLGAMMVIFRFKGQRDSVGLFPWEEMFRTVRESQTGSEWASIVRACCYEIQGKGGSVMNTATTHVKVKAEYYVLWDDHTWTDGHFLEVAVTSGDDLFPSDSDIHQALDEETDGLMTRPEYRKAVLLVPSHYVIIA